MIRKNHPNNIQPTDRAELLVNSRQSNLETGQNNITEEDKQILHRMEWEMWQVQIRLKKVNIGLQVLHQDDEEYSKFAEEKVRLQTRLKDLQNYHHRVAGIKEQQQSPEIEQKWKTASRKIQQEKEQQKPSSKTQYLPSQIREKFEQLSQSRKQWQEQTVSTHLPQEQNNKFSIKRQQDTLKQIDITNNSKPQTSGQAEQSFKDTNKGQEQIEDPLILAKHRSRVAQIQLRLAQENIRNNHRNTLQNQLMFLQSRQVWDLYLCRYKDGKKTSNQL